MSAPLPLCAWCGKSLKFKDSGGQGQSTTQWPNELGTPIVGWHIKCGHGDPCLKGVVRGDEPWEILEAVHKRGPGRIVERYLGRWVRRQ